MAEIKGPGALWVTSRVAKSSESILDEQTFLKWYDEDHIAEIVETDGMKDAFRYINVDKGSPSVAKPFLAVYPMPDLAFTQGPAFKKFRVKSDILPGTGIVYDMADLDVSYLALVGQSGQKKTKEAAEYLLVSAIEPAEGTPDADVNKFFDEQLAAVSKEPNYMRSFRFRLLSARSNAQSRAMKGLQTENVPPPEPPTWQAVHEFSEDPGSAIRDELRGHSSELLKKAKQNELHVYKLAKVHGRGKFFE